MELGRHRTAPACFNCLTPRVIITWKGWTQRDAFLAALRGALAGIPTRNAYYPGADDRRRSFIEAHPDAVEIGDAADVIVEISRTCTLSPGDVVWLGTDDKPRNMIRATSPSRRHGRVYR